MFNVVIIMISILKAICNIKDKLNLSQPDDSRDLTHLWIMGLATRMYEGLYTQTCADVRMACAHLTLPASQPVRVLNDTPRMKCPWHFTCLRLSPVIFPILKLEYFQVIST